jgi:ferredoxin-type protein NapF
LHPGDGGFPIIDFSSSGCCLCGACARVCPTSAIGKDTTRRAFAWHVEVSSGCLTHHGVECRVCGDLCDTGVLRFVPAVGGIRQMRVDLAACTGCGACVAPCPVAAISLKASASQNDDRLCGDRA